MCIVSRWPSLADWAGFPPPRWHKLTFLCWRAVEQPTNQANLAAFCDLINLKSNFMKSECSFNSILLACIYSWYKKANCWRSSSQCDPLKSRQCPCWCWTCAQKHREDSYESAVNRHHKSRPKHFKRFAFNSYSRMLELIIAFCVLFSLGLWVLSIVLLSLTVQPHYQLNYWSSNSVLQCHYQLDYWTSCLLAVCYTVIINWTIGLLAVCYTVIINNNSNNNTYAVKLLSGRWTTT